MNTYGVLVTLLLSLLVLSLPRRASAATIIAAVCYITQGQQFQLGFHFTAIRIVLLAGIIRVITRGELSRIHFNMVDRSLLVYAIGIAFIATIRNGPLDGFVYQLGFLYNVLLSYFVFRSLLTNREEVIETLPLMTIVILPFAFLMVRESMTNHNIFSALGGTFSSDMVRDGHVRSQCSFRSPITAGSFGALFAMLYASMLFGRARRRNALFGLAASLVILICAHSSGPLLGLVMGVFALALWPFRQHTRKFRWVIVIALVVLSFVMKSPVWFLLARVSDVVGGGGYHRAYLIDHFVKSFGSWWLMGDSDTGAWMATQLSDGQADITSQFVADGLKGGIIGLILSVTLVVRCFQWVSRSMDALAERDPNAERITWGFGAAMVCSIGILFSVTYFDQMQVVGYLLIACIASQVPNYGEASAPLSDQPQLALLPAE